jgi:Spy/CpxP family protein refolding chaperone
LNGPLQAGGGQGGGIVGRFVQGPQNQIIRVLTEAQTASLVQIMQSQRNVLLDAETKLASARKDLVLASVAEKFDENLIRTKAMNVAKLDAEMSVLRARMFSQIKPPLSAAQLENLKSAPTDGVGLRPRLNGQTGDAGGNALPLRPPQRTLLRDENDLPVATPAGK